MKSRGEARIKRARAVELAVQGKSYGEIAREVGFSHRGSAHRAVSKALAEREVAAVEQLRQIELDRLDRLHAAMWPKAMAGDLTAVQIVLRVIDQRIRLYGLGRKTAEYGGLTTLVIGPPEGNPGDATE